MSVEVRLEFGIGMGMFLFIVGMCYILFSDMILISKRKHMDTLMFFAIACGAFMCLFCTIRKNRVLDKNIISSMPFEWQSIAYAMESLRDPEREAEYITTFLQQYDSIQEPHPQGDEVSLLPRYELSKQLPSLTREQYEVIKCCVDSQKTQQNLYDFLTQHNLLQ